MPERDAPTKTQLVDPLVGSSGLNFFDGKDISIVGMSFLPPVSLPPLPLPSRPGPTAMGRPAFLPPAVPSNMPALMPTAAAAKNSVLEPTVPSEKKKGGRPSKADKLKAAKASASEAIVELIETEPTKKDIYNYFENRIAELRT